MSIIIITTVRVLDEVLRIHFFRKKVKKWTLISAVKTFVPVIIVLISLKLNSEHFLFLSFGIYSFLVVFTCIPRIFIKSVGVPNLKVVQNEFFHQSIFSFASTSRRSVDRVLVYLFFNNDLAFSYNIIIQVATGSVLIFDKFLQILERQSYLVQSAKRIVVGRVPFAMISMVLALFIIELDQRTQAIEGVTISVLMACVLGWVLSVVDRELEYNWWQGRKIALLGSFVSLSMSGIYLLTVLAMQNYDMLNIQYVLLASVICMMNVYLFVWLKSK